jgi:hypothetical protein
MGWTSAQVTLIENAIISLATGAKTVTINGRSWTKENMSELLKLRDAMIAEVNAATYGASIPIAFDEVTD